VDVAKGTFLLKYFRSLSEEHELWKKPVWRI